MRSLIFLSICVMLVIFAGCTSIKDLAVTQKEYGIRRMPNAGDFPNADAVTVIESHMIDMNFDTNDEIYTVEEGHVVQKVFRNFDKYANVEIYLDYKDKLMSIEARTISPNGEITTLMPKDFHTATGVTTESEFISDRKAVRFAFKNVQQGSILEYKYRLMSDFMYGGYTWYVQHDHPVMVNVLRLSIPKYLIEKARLRDEKGNEYNWNWAFKAYGMDIGEPEMIKPISNQAEDEQKYIFTWNLKKIHSVKREPYCPPYIETTGHVRFAVSRSWNSIGKRYVDYLWKPQAISTPKLSEKINQVIQNASGNKEKVKLLSDYVKSIRYTAIELGMGGYVPRKPQEVMDSKYGDCKDKATLLITMLRSVGIPAKPVLVRTYDHGLIDPDFPSLGWFNHMIVKVELPEEIIWIDPTYENSQFGEIPYLDEGIWVCVLDSGKTQIERTPVRGDAENKMNVKIQAEVKGDTWINFHFTIEHYGNWALFLYDDLKDKPAADLQKYCKSLIADEFLNSKIQNVKFSKRENLEKPMMLEFDAEAPNAIFQQGDLYYANIDPFKMFKNLTWLGSERRTFPIHYSYPYSIHKTVEVKLPETYRVRNLPKTINLNTYDLNYVRSYENSADAKLIYNEDYALKSREIPVSEYANIQSFFTQIQNGAAEKVVLQKP